MAETNQQTTEALEPCPFCKAMPQETDLAPSQRYRINHESDCWLVGRLMDLRGREGRSHFIALRDADTWNSRVSTPIAPVVGHEVLGSAVVGLLNAFHGSGHCGVDVMVSARLRGCEKCNVLSSTLDRIFATAPASPAAIRDEAETEICPVCKDEVPADSMLSYNNIPNAFCQGCVDSGRV